MTDSASEESLFDKLRRRVFWSMPSGLYVLGSRAGDRRNGMTINWVTQVSAKPVRLAVAVKNDAFTHELLSEGSAFALSFVQREDRALVRKFVKPAPFDPEAMTLNGVPIRDGATGAPILVQAAAYLDCSISDRVITGDHTLFIGDVVDAGFSPEESETTDPTPVEVLRMEDTRMNYGG